MTNEDIKLYAAKFVAGVLFIGVACLALIPWFVPLIWEMPENTMYPYYGILIMIESLRGTVSEALKEAKANKKQACKKKACKKKDGTCQN